MSKELEGLIKMFDGQPSERHTLEVELGDLRKWHAEIERLRAALKPFALMADQVDEWQKSTGSFTGSFNANDLQQARAAYEQTNDHV